MAKKIKNNGFDYVDLGLPSGTLWATCNVGASKPTDYGLYFQWGDTAGYTKDQVGKIKQFYFDTYKWSINGSNENFIKYNTHSETLELEDDAAHVNMGGGWHMPTSKQIQELIDNTENEFTTLDGVNGMTFTSKKGTSKFIFIPAEGYTYGHSVSASGEYGCIWSSSISSTYVSLAQELQFDSLDAYHFPSSRSDGFSVRGVIDGKQDDTKDKKENVTVKKENKTIIDKHNSLKAFNNEIKSLQEKIKEIWKKKNALLSDDYSKKYTGKYVKITTYDMDKEELSYINECIYVRNAYTDIDSDNLSLTLQGQGFRYCTGDYLDDIEGNFSETYSKTIYENWLIDGLVKIDIISKDEYKKQVNKMINFISKDFEDVEATE